MSATGQKYARGADVSAEAAIQIAVRSALRLRLLLVSSQQPRVAGVVRAPLASRQKEQLLQSLNTKSKEQQDLPALQAQLGTIVADARAALVRWAT